MDEIEDSEFVASEHDRLVSAISKLDKTQHIIEPTRNEPTNTNTEFSLIKRSNKLDLGNVAKVLVDTATHLKISKKLKKTQDTSKVLPKPLERPQAEREKRATGYRDTKKKVGRWDPVVARGRTADFVVYPIKPAVDTKLQLTNEFLSRFELKSNLERELLEVDPQPALEEDEEEEKIYPMSYEEMVEHRQHSAKLRAQQSYKAAKAKRQSKIKSKKFHRVLKKERLKQQLKEFEELQKSNPEEALKKLETIEKARALERHTLRHKNTGKWAKNKLIRAKYDKDVRQEIADQLAVSRSLTQKSENVNSSDEDDDEANDNEVIPDINLSQDPMNPWMLKKAGRSNVAADFDFGYKKYLKDRMFKRKDEQDSDSEPEANNDNNEMSSELNILKQKIKNISQNLSEDPINFDENQDISNDKLDDMDESISVKDKDNKGINKLKVSKQSQKVPKHSDSKVTKPKDKLKSKKIKLSATSNWIVEIVKNTKPDQDKTIDLTSAFETLESKVVGKVNRKLKSLKRQIANLEKADKKKPKNIQNPKVKPEIDNLEYLKLRNQRPKAIIDEELIETGYKDGEVVKDDLQSQVDIIKTASAVAQPSDSNNIDPNRFIQVKPKYLNTALPEGENNMDLLDDDEQVVPKVNIEEVFEEDDVVASFRQEKEEEVNKDKPEEIDLSLPGWGSWGGVGVKAPKKRKNRFITKPAPIMPRRDENKGDIIIKEYRDPKLAIHKVKEIPYPFTSVRDYEASIRAPLGNTFIPERAHKKLIQPSVITKAGAIIEPMDEEELLVKKNRAFKNEKILKIIGQK